MVSLSVCLSVFLSVFLSMSLPTFLSASGASLAVALGKALDTEGFVTLFVAGGLLTASGCAVVVGVDTGSVCCSSESTSALD